MASTSIPSTPRRTAAPSRSGGSGALRHAAVVGASIVVAIAVWWVVARLEIWRPLFVPSPESVWDQLVRTESTSEGRRGYSGHYLHEHLWASLRRILQGIAVAIVLGVPLGLLIAVVRPVGIVLMPAIDFVRSLPPLAYFSLLVIWFGIEERPKVVLLFLAALPPIVIATADAVRNVPTDRVLAVRSLGAGRVQEVRHVVLPSILPELMTGIRVAVGFAFTTVVAAETINGMPGIGGVVRDAQRFNQTDVVVLGIIVIGVTGVLLDYAVRLIDRWLVPWRGHG